MNYRTGAGYIIKIKIDSVRKKWRARTNDFEIYHKYIDNLEWKSKKGAQDDLDKIAKKTGMKTESGYYNMNNLCKICGQDSTVDHNGCIIIGMGRA